MVSCRSFAKALAATPSDRAKIALVEELAGAAALVAMSVCYVRAARRYGYEDSAHLILFAYIPFFLLFAAGVGGLVYWTMYHLGLPETEAVVFGWVGGLAAS